MSILISWLGPLRAICMAIDGVAFSLLDNAYMLVIKLSTAELFQHETIRSITNNVYILIGVVAFFRLAIVLVNAIIDPEKLNEKGKGLSNIFFRVVGMVILLAVTPFLFQLSYELQGKIVGGDADKNIIFKTILGDNANMGGANAGKALQNIALSSLITVNENYLEGDGAICESGEADGSCGFMPLTCVSNKDGTCTNQGGYIYGNECDWDNCYSAVSLYNDLYVNEDMSPTKLAKWAGVSKKIDGEEVYVYDYMMIMTTVVGIFMTYIIISFAIDIAVRMFELLVLEVLSPLFIATFVDPKSSQSGPFKNWLSAVGKSYASLYIKLAILALIILLISLVNQSKIFNEMGDLSGWTKIFVVIGLLIFAKKAPKWIMDIIGIKGDDSGLGGLSIGKKLGGMALAGGAAKWAGDKLKQGGRALAGAGIGTLARTAAGRRSIRDQQKQENKNRKKMGEKRPKGQYMKNWKDRAVGGLRAGGEGFVEGIRQGAKTDKASDLLKMPGSIYSEGRQKFTPEYEGIGAKINARVDDINAGKIKKSFGSEYDRIERGKESDKQKVGKRWYDKDMKLSMGENGWLEHDKKKQPMSGKEMTDFSAGSTDPNDICSRLIRDAFGGSIDDKGRVFDASGIEIKDAKAFIGNKSPELLAQVESTAASNTTQFAKDLKNLTDAMNEASSRYSRAASEINKFGMDAKSTSGGVVHLDNSDFYKLSESISAAKKNNADITEKDLKAAMEPIASSLGIATDSFDAVFEQAKAYNGLLEISAKAKEDLDITKSAVDDKWKVVESLNKQYEDNPKENPMVTFVNGIEQQLRPETAYNIDALITGFSGKEASKKEDLEKRKQEAEKSSGKQE